MPLVLVEGRPAVDVKLGDREPFLLILDTGASATVLNADLVEELELPSEGQVLLADPSGGTGTAGHTHRLEELSISGWVFRDVFAVSWEGDAIASRLGGPRGVLGAPSLAGVTLEFDFPGLQLRIRSERLAEGDGSQLFTNPQSVIPSVEISVADTTLEAHVDTGNGRGLGLPSTLRDRLSFEGVLERKTARSASGDFAIQVGQMIGTVRIGQIEVVNPDVFLNERFPTANVGTPALLHTRMALDVGRRRIRLEGR